MRALPFSGSVLALGLAALAVLPLRAESAQYRLAREDFEATRFPDAIAILRSVAREPGEFKLLGRCYLLEGDYKAASEAIEKAVALAPNDADAEVWLARAYGHHAEHSFGPSAISYARKSRETFELAIRLDPGHPGAMGDLFEFYVQAPGFVGGGTEKARALLPQIQKHDPIGYEIAQATLAGHEKDYSQAESHLRSAIALDASQPASHINLAKFLARRGRYQESDAAFAQARAADPEAHPVDFEQAETLLKNQRNREQARHLLRGYIASSGLTPNDPPRAEALKLLKKAGGGEAGAF